MAGISASLTGWDKVVRAVDKPAAFETRELAEIAAVELEKLTAEAFESETDPVDGAKWKKSKTGAGSTLWDSGDLFRANESVVDDYSVEIGNNKIYARIHQEGGVIKAKGAPWLHFKVNGSWVKVKQVEIPRRRYLGHPADWPDRTLMEMPEVRSLLEPRV